MLDIKLRLRELRQEQHLRDMQYLDLLTRVATHGYLYVYIQEGWKEFVELFRGIKNYRCLTSVVSTTICDRTER